MQDKFIYITDVHFGAYPANRIDVYNQSILKKLEYSLKLCRKNEATLLIGGDLFDTPKTKLLDLNLIMKLLAKFPDVQVFCLRGNENHDGIKDNSPLDILKISGIIETHAETADFPGGTHLIFCDHGVDFNDTDHLIDPLKFNIMMTHFSIVKESVIFEHILAKDLQTKANMVMVAHYHPYQGIFKTDAGTIFVAPGAISRRKKTKHDIGRVPKAVFIVVEDGKLKGTKELDIPCSQDIWNKSSTLESVEELWYDAQVVKEVSNMREMIDTAGEVFLSLEDCLKKFGEMKSLESDVIELCLNSLRKV